MLMDIVGPIRNLQLTVTQPLIPLFECLVNSIEAIKDAGISDGRIDVLLERDARQVELDGNKETALAAIRDITIVDNGSGFNDGNVREFRWSDSTRKVAPGDKGIGRFTWLKVFREAAVDSIYVQDGDPWMRHTFKFLLTPESIEGEEVDEAKTKERRTPLTFAHVRPEYEKHFLKSLETIAHKIIAHPLIDLVSGINRTDGAHASRFSYF